MLRRLRQLIRDVRGATAVEYAVVLGLIAGAVILSVNSMTSATVESFNNSGEALESVLGP